MRDWIVRASWHWAALRCVVGMSAVAVCCSNTYQYHPGRNRKGCFGSYLYPVGFYISGQVGTGRCVSDDEPYRLHGRLLDAQR